MNCPRCRAENPPQAKFCLECATPFARRCANCGTQLPSTAKFCFECAQPVEGQAFPPRFVAPESYTPKHLAERIINSKAAIEGERKHVTVLFADLKGSMELLADRDPEEARKVLDPVLERMMEAVHHYEGTVNQVMGDGIMALFGAPLAHEDHAVRACYAALRMQESVARYAEAVFHSHGVPLQIRVGLNSGEVVVRAIGSDLHMDYTAVGQTTHVGARMEQMATPGTILLAPATMQLADGYVHVEARGPVVVKGLAEPMEIYTLTGASSQRTRLHAAAARGLTRFVGRDAEVAQIRRAVALAHDGHGQLVAIVGEPGVGKSRLLYELTHSSSTRGWLILEAGSVSYGKSTSYLPVIDLLKTYFTLHDDEGHREIREKVTHQLLALDRALEPAVPALLALLDVPVDDASWEALDPPQRRQRTLDAVKRLLLRESRVRPLLVIFEDLHWIDSETQAFLESLVDSLPTARLLLLVNYRPEYQHGWGSKTYYTQLRLDTLRSESADELLQALLGTDASVTPIKPLLIARTGGNPLFLEESVRALVETNALVGERGAYRLVKHLDTVDIPATVQAILASRIDRLDLQDKQLLQTASVVGKDVPLPLLLAVAELREDDLRRGLAHLKTAEFLYETSLFPNLEFTFKHALTYEVAYGSLLHERRRALHARVVATLEELHGDRLPEQFESLAHHAYRGEQWQKAVYYARLAGDEAAARSAHRQVIELCHQAISALEHMPETEGKRREEVEIRFAMRNAYLATGNADAIPANLHRALTLADALDDSLWRSRITTALAHYHWLKRELPQALPLAHRGIELAKRAGDAVEVAGAHGVRGRVHWARGEYGAAVPVFQRCLEIESSEAPRAMGAIIAVPSVVTNRWLAQSLAEIGSFEAAIAAGREAVHTAEARNHPYSLANAFNALGIVMLRRGRFVEAGSLLERTVEVAREFGFGEFMAPIQPFLANAYAGAGRRTDACATLDASRESLSSAPHYQARIGEAALAVGALPQARQHAEAALEFSRRQTARGEEAWSLYLLGAVNASEEPGSVAASESYYRQGLALAEVLDMRPLVAHCRLGLGMLYRGTDKREQAQEHLTTAVTIYRDTGMTYWLERAERELES